MIGNKSGEIEIKIKTAKFTDGYSVFIQKVIHCINSEKVHSVNKENIYVQIRYGKKGFLPTKTRFKHVKRVLMSD